ncbi:MsnO8 family LLM class oxidoreductase [Deinococcus hopiensis]|uniref:MsnO8 family LLM class oxidoreductase n=1 Tax=Deinococcus hopiensis TaxID=309885 RepID=UPI0009FBC10F|nr:MsnO8 family LLM class oxidoreductase [Deinococcus hopiensis]
MLPEQAARSRGRATELLIAALTERTNTLRLSASGIMLPNHAPLKVAETFRLLGALGPGRINPGLGRGPGTDMNTALVLRRSQEALQADAFESQLAELMAFSGQDFPERHPFWGIVAVPHDQPLPPLWILSSSGHDAAVAAKIGAGLAIAAPINLDMHLSAQAAQHYRASFQSSAQFPEPRVLGLSRWFSQKSMRKPGPWPCSGERALLSPAWRKRRCIPTARRNSGRLTPCTAMEAL